MKRLTAFILVLAFLLALVGCGSKLVEGSEQTWSGTVTDRGMSVVKEGDRTGRPYLLIMSDGQEEICFWLLENCETPAGIGDRVTVESAIEADTGLLVATQITLK